MSEQFLWDLLNSQCLQLQTPESKNLWEVWLPIIFQGAVAIFTLVTLFFMHNENKRNTYLPYITTLYGELNDIILSLYHLFNNPQCETSTNDKLEENYLQQRDDFLKGHRYFVISSIPTEQPTIDNIIKSSGRRKMYFNELRKRYISIYESLEKAANKSSGSKPFYKYISQIEYKIIYDSYKNMKDIT